MAALGDLASPSITRHDDYKTYRLSPLSLEVSYTYGNIFQTAIACLHIDDLSSDLQQHNVPILDQYNGIALR